MNSVFYSKPVPPIPQAVRSEVWARSKGRCEGCGIEWPARLEYHHNTYYKWDVRHGDLEWAMDIFGMETAVDLDLLCRECHKQKHTGPWGEFHADPEHAAGEWAYVHYMMDKND